MRMGLMGTPMPPEYGMYWGVDDEDALNPDGMKVGSGDLDPLGDIRRINSMIGKGNSVGGRHVGQSAIYASRFGRDSAGGNRFI